MYLPHQARKSCLLFWNVTLGRIIQLMQGKVTIICKMCVLCDAFMKFCLSIIIKGKWKKNLLFFLTLFLRLLALVWSVTGSLKCVSLTTIIKCKPNENLCCFLALLPAFVTYVWTVIEPMTCVWLSTVIKCKPKKLFNSFLSVLLLLLKWENA